MLEKLKNHGNRHYKFYDDYNTYQARCQNEDPSGHNIIFDDDLVQGNVDVMSSDMVDIQDEIIDEKYGAAPELTDCEETDNDENDEEKEEKIYATKEIPI